MKIFDFTLKTLCWVLVATFSITLSACDDEHVTPNKGDIKTDIVNYNKIDDRYATSGRLGKGSVKELKDLGFGAIIDFRNDSENTLSEKEEAEKHDISYVNIPINGSNISNKNIQDFSKIFENENNKPMLIHCGSGNRAGAMLTLYHHSKGMSIEDAIKIGRKAGMKPAMEKSINAIIDEGLLLYRK